MLGNTDGARPSGKPLGWRARRVSLTRRESAHHTASVAGWQRFFSPVAA
jgi:hypothetical protein